MYNFQNWYRVLETLCELLNIKLFGTSWESLANQKIQELRFKTYRPMQTEELIQLCDHLDFEDYDSYDKSFMISAADDKHPGLMTQLSYAGHFVERLKNDIKN
jgi:hypothetical protein